MSNKMNITEAFINEYIKSCRKAIKNENSNVSINKLADFIRKSVEELIKSQDGCSEYKLDNDLSVFVGWSDGYSAEHDDTIIQANEDPTFAINVGIKSNHDYLKTDYDWLNYPYDPETGEVWDSGITISPNENYSEIAKWLLNEYSSIKKAIADNKIIVEARSHKEDNEKAAPRTTVNKNGKEVKTRNMVDVSNPKVGNNSYHNQKGHQYWGTTSKEYASKRNKTGKKNSYGYDVYLADYDDMNTPVSKYQYEKNQAQSLINDRDEMRDKEKKARNQVNKEYWKNIADNLDSQIDKHNQEASNIVSSEKERIANKTQTTENKKLKSKALYESNDDEFYNIETEIDTDSVERNGNIISGSGTINYYKTQEDLDNKKPSSYETFTFEYDVDDSNDTLYIYDTKYAGDVDEDKIKDYIKNEVIPNTDDGSTVSLLAVAYRDIPKIGIDDWGKDNELYFHLDTKKLLSYLEDYEVEIPKYLVDNEDEPVDTYLSDYLGINLDDGEFDNSYNWGSRLTHDLEIATYTSKEDGTFYVKLSVHRDGDVRGNYTTDFLLRFDDKDNFYETMLDAQSSCANTFEFESKKFWVEPHIFDEYVDISIEGEDDNWTDVYCEDLDQLKEIISENSEK